VQAVIDSEQNLNLNKSKRRFAGDHSKNAKSETPLFGRSGALIQKFGSAVVYFMKQKNIKVLLRLS
jgi:hypothetical protein